MLRISSSSGISSVIPLTHISSCPSSSLLLFFLWALIRLGRTCPAPACPAVAVLLLSSSRRSAFSPFNRSATSPGDCAHPSAFSLGCCANPSAPPLARLLRANSLANAASTPSAIPSMMFLGVVNLPTALFTRSYLSSSSLISFCSSSYASILAIVGPSSSSSLPSYGIPNSSKAISSIAGHLCLLSKCSDVWVPHSSHLYCNTVPQFDFFGKETNFQPAYCLCDMSGFSLFSSSRASFINCLVDFLGSSTFRISSCFSLAFPLSLYPHPSGHLVIFTSPFSQSISGLCICNQGIPNMTLFFPRPHISKCTLSLCPL